MTRRPIRSSGLHPVAATPTKSGGRHRLGAVRRPHLATLAFTLAVPLVAATSVLASAISVKYASLGGSSGFLGNPTIPELVAPDGVGRYRHYQGGSIYWHPRTGAHEVHGLIREEWAALGWEQSDLGYPMTDELDTFDGAGKVSKFQGGQLFWSGSTTGVTILRSTDLIVDLPFAAGEVWRVIQANGVNPKDSHGGRWAYAWDLERAPLFAFPQVTFGHPFRSVADGRVTWELDGFQAGDGEDNRIAIRLGEGRYASYLHAVKGSFDKRFPHGILDVQAGSWDGRPDAKGGTVLGETGNVCEGSCGPHLHFAVTTKPDIKEFLDFETVPVAFRNYSVSRDEGKTWSYVWAGIPRTGDWIRRGPTTTMTAPIIQGSVSPIRHGSVSGKITIKNGSGAPAGVGSVTVVAMAPWGEPLASAEIPFTTASGGQAFYSLERVPAFEGLTIEARYHGPWSFSSNPPVLGRSGKFDLEPYGSAVADVMLEAIIVH